MHYFTEYSNELLSYDMIIQQLSAERMAPYSWQQTNTRTHKFGCKGLVKGTVKPNCEHKNSNNENRMLKTFKRSKKAFICAQLFLQRSSKQKLCPFSHKKRWYFWLKKIVSKMHSFMNDSLSLLCFSIRFCNKQVVVGDHKICRDKCPAISWVSMSSSILYWTKEMWHVSLKLLCYHWHLTSTSNMLHIWRWTVWTSMNFNVDTMLDIQI